MEHPVIVEVRDDLFHERLRQPDRAVRVAEVIDKDCERKLPRALALIGPLEAVFGEALHLVVLAQRATVDGDDKTVWMEKDKVYKVTLTPMNTSNYFAQGHSIRIEVAGANFPRFDRNLNTGGNNYDETTSVIAHTEIHHSAQYPSTITLSVVKH